jgi:endogenous inhibitor of DNA gyrase (YacG/DUF329 family)
MACPICKKPTDPVQRPFCSARCKDVDLGKWLSGSYAVPGPPIEDEDLPKRDDDPLNQ